MNTLLRSLVGAFLGVALVFGTALAIEYDEIFEMTARGSSEESIVQLIVEDGRGFELNSQELDDLRDAGVSEVVIDAMLDPEAGRRWLAGDDAGYDDDSYNGSGGGSGYSTSLDEAYGQGYADGRSTALVYSFGYYYGPLSRYYYDDPFYYSFWSSGYASSYWPSYYAYWYRPAYSYYYAYPYNYYTYDSFYCHTYYDPGYWTAQGYTVLPGYGRTVWDDGPRWRDGGIAPPKGGRTNTLVTVRDQIKDGSRNRLRNPSGPPAIREAIADLRTPPSERGAARVRTPNARTPEGGKVARGNTERGERVARGNPERGKSGMRDVTRDRIVKSSPERGERVARNTPRAGRSAPHVVRSTPRVEREVPRTERSARAREAPPRVGRREATERSYQRGREWSRSENRIERRAAPAPERVRVIRGNRDEGMSRPRPSQESRREVMRERVRDIDRGGYRREEGRREVYRPAPEPAREPARVEYREPPRPQRAEAPPQSSRGGNDGNRGGDRGHRGRGGR